MKKKSGDSTKNSEILFFPRLNSAPLPGPTSLSKWRTDEEQNDKLLKTSTNHSSVQKKVQCFLSPHGTNYSIFIEELNLFHFRNIFPQNPWDWDPSHETAEMTNYRETHGRTVRVGRSASSKYGYKADVSSDHIIGTTTSSKVKSSRWARKFEPEVKRAKQKTEQKNEKKNIPRMWPERFLIYLCLFFFSRVFLELCGTSKD